MYNREIGWWTSFRRWFNTLYLVAFIFITISVALYLLLKNAVVQAIAAALFGSGLTILVTTITAGQSVRESYRKDANLQRKREVYGPLHAELKELRQLFEKARQSQEPFPQWIKIQNENYYPSSYMTGFSPPSFSFWPVFKEDYHIDDFTPSNQKLLNDLQDLIVAYNNTVDNARKSMKSILRPHIADGIKQVEQDHLYQEWLKKHSQPPYVAHRWYEFIERNLSFSATSTVPLGDGLAGTWSLKIGWLLANLWDEAAHEIYDKDASSHWGAPDLVPFSWFQNIFQSTFDELKNEQAFSDALATQEKLFKTLKEAEDKLEKALRYIRDHYEGGTPPF